MKDNTKFLTGLLIGAAAGSLVTVFLQGEKGQKLLRSIKETAESTGEELKDGLGRIQYTTDNIFQKGKRFISDFTKKDGDVEDIELDEIFS